jgi:hypothetical protein
MYSTVHPPQEAAHNDVDNVCQDDESPEDLTEQIPGCHQEDGLARHVSVKALLELDRLYYVDGDYDGTADNGQYNEHVPAHARKA